MIQIIGYNQKDYSDFSNSDYIISMINNPKSFDEFEINIIDFSNKNIWCNNNDSTRSINIMNDFINIGIIIKNAVKSKIIVVYPQNSTFYYDHSSYQKSYHKNIELKNMLSELVSHLITSAIDYKNYSLQFENTTTKLNSYDYEASFFFTGVAESNRKTFSYKSEKTTTIHLEDKNLFLTTLNIFNSIALLHNFLQEMELLQNNENAPEWIQSIIMFDDEKQQENIDKSTATINVARNEIEKSTDILMRNSRWKSVLYSNGTQLVDVVFEMLNNLLDCDLSGFIDKKREDFAIIKENVTFVGEIKGVTSNVRSENISQLDVHYQSYIDKLHEDGKSETVKSILIINHQRNKAPNQREPVHNNQIQLAIRNGSLIIESSTLLKMFEMYQNQHMNASDCISVFAEKTGILKIEDIIKSEIT